MGFIDSVLLIKETNEFKFIKTLTGKQTRLSLGLNIIFNKLTVIKNNSTNRINSLNKSNFDCKFSNL